MQNLATRNRLLAEKLPFKSGKDVHAFMRNATGNRLCGSGLQLSICFGDRNVFAGTRRHVYAALKERWNYD